MERSNRTKTLLCPTPQRICVVGAGGTGSYLIQGLAKLISGYRLGVEVVVIDPDTVEEKNCRRQNFAFYEIGLNKSEAVVARINQQYGVDFAFHVGRGEDFPFQRGHTLVITCVDTLKARRPYKDTSMWLDLGNDRHFGQAIFGTTHRRKTLKKEGEKWQKNPHVSELPNAYLKTGMARRRDKRNEPSCADMPDHFREQGVFVNEWAAQAGLSILQQILVQGLVSTPAIYFDTEKGRMVPARITQEYLVA